MFELRQGPPWRLEHRYAGCGHCIIAPIPNRGYEIVAASSEMTPSLLQEVKTLVMPPGSGWESHSGRRLQRFVTSSRGSIISGSLFVLDESDELDRKGVIYGHAIVTSRKEFEALHGAQPSFLDDYLRVLYWNSGKAVEATMVDIVRGLRNQDGQLLQQNLPTLLHMMSAIGPWSVMADLLVEAPLRSRFLGWYKSRGVKDFGLKRALRSGYCVLFECSDPDGEVDFEPLMHQCLHALVTSRRAFRFASRALGEEGDLDVACADRSLIGALALPRPNRTLVVCKAQRAIVVRPASSLAWLDQG